MTDYKRLKHLALAQPVLEWKSEEGQLSMMTGERMYHVIGPAGVSCWEHGAYSRVSASYIAAANHSAVLDLIDENERLKDQVRLAGISAEATVHDAIGRAANDYLLVTLERDQLKAENEALRKDAERYRYMRNGAYCVATIDGYRIICEEPLPAPFAEAATALDLAIDAAMGKGEQS